MKQIWRDENCTYVYNFNRKKGRKENHLKDLNIND